MSQNNPWVVRPDKAAYVPLPVGSYCGRFVSVVPMEVKNPHKAGAVEDRWRWTWEVTTGPHAGHAGTALTEQDISPMWAATRSSAS